MAKDDCWKVVLMGYGKNYGGGMTLGSLVNGGTAFMVLSLVALIASIVCTVIVYKKFVSTGGTHSRDIVGNTSWIAPFLRFDTLIIEKLLKALYLFGAISTVFFALAFLISSLFVSMGSFMATLIGVIVGVPISEVIHRIVYEFLMLNIVIARNTTEIRNAVQGDNAQKSVPPAQGTSGNVVPPSSDTASSVTAEQAHNVQAAAAPGSGAEPSSSAGGVVGEAGASQKVCPNCNAPLKQGQKFCGVCGKSLN